MAERRVLYLSNSHPRMQLGGAEVYSYDLFRAMREAGEFAPVLVARTTAAGHPRRASTSFFAVGDDPDQVLWKPRQYDDLMMTSHDKQEYTVQLRGLLQAYRPDVVHVQHLIGLGMDVLRLIKSVRPRTPIVYTLHEFLSICHHHGLMLRTFSQELCRTATPMRCHQCFEGISPQQFFLRERFVKAQLKNVDLFLAPSRLLLERYCEWGIPRDKIRFQRNGRSLPGPPLDDEAPPPTRIGFFGQLKAHKGIAVLLRAIQLLRAEGPTDVQLYVNGANLEAEGAEFARQVAGLIEDCGASVVFLGRYEPEELSQRMRQVAWVVVPSIWWENSPLVIQEAFLHRRPVICSDVGGMAEMVSDGADGLHFRIGDAADLAAVLRRATASPETWERLRDGIRPPYTMAEAAADHAEIYRSLLAGAGAEDRR